ncbi:tyrosine-type recombinase/integrase [Phytomonospora sp. NPDC050363]|uniref:tyrosine-type recombinase/integrase n=1 Tax=Phytomonospora sp. NPDC050363 TaxID=3155642 RepID=UPI0034038695
MILRAYRQRREQQAAELGVTIAPDGRVFSNDPNHSTWLTPLTVSQRYARMRRAIGIDTTTKNLRHFSATELIAASIDVRTIAGRLGHSGGGTTTLIPSSRQAVD